MHLPFSARTRAILAFVAVAVVAIVAVVYFHGRATHQPAGSRANPAVSEAPAPNHSAIPPAKRTMTTVSSTDRQAITAVARLFVMRAFSFRYTDKPGDVDRRVHPLLSPAFQGALPEPPGASSNAGQGYRANKTAALAYIASDSDIVFAWTQPGSASVKVDVSLATSGTSSDSSQLSHFTCTLTLTRSLNGWLVSRLSEGEYGQ